MQIMVQGFTWNGNKNLFKEALNQTADEIQPLHKLVTIANFLSILVNCWLDPMNKTTFSCRVFVKVATSDLKASRAASSSMFFISMIRIATSPCHLPLKTIEQTWLIIEHKKSWISSNTWWESPSTNRFFNFQIIKWNIPFAIWNWTLTSNASIGCGWVLTFQMSKYCCTSWTWRSWSSRTCYKILVSKFAFFTHCDFHHLAKKKIKTIFTLTKK